MLALNHLAEQEKAREKEKAERLTNQSSSTQVFSDYTKNFNQKYDNLKRYMDILDSRIEYHRSEIEKKRKELSSKERTDKINTEKERIDSLQREIAAKEEIKNNEAKQPKLAATPLAARITTPEHIQADIASNTQSVPRYTNAPNMNSAISSVTGPDRPVMANNTTVNIAPNVANVVPNKNNAWQKSNRIDGNVKNNNAQNNYSQNSNIQINNSYQAQQNQVQSNVNNNGYNTQNSNVYNQNQNEIFDEFNNINNNTYVEEYIPLPDDFVAPLDSENVVSNILNDDEIDEQQSSQTYTGAELNLGKEFVYNRIIYKNEVALSNKPILSDKDFFIKVNDSYVQDLSRAKLAPNILEILKASTRLDDSTANEWHLCFPKVFDKLFENSAFLKDIERELSQSFQAEIKLSVDFSEMLPEEETVIGKVKSFYLSKKQNIVNELSSNVNYQRNITKLGLDLEHSRVELTELEQ